MKAALMIAGLAALMGTIPGLYTGMLLVIAYGNFLLFPLPAVILVGLAALAFNRAETM